MDTASRRPLGSSGITVSDLSIGSWLTFEYLPRETGIAVLRRARECGIDFFDDARYDDRSGTAPMPTGYSEVVFGEIFRGAGIARDEVVVANKLWLEFWPRQGVAEEVHDSLRRMGFDHLDLLYSSPPPAGMDLADLVGQVGRLLAAGTARAWGILNWPAEQIAEAARICEATGVPSPAAAQLPYSLVERSPVEDAAAADVLRAHGVSVVASAVLAGGALTGRYARPDGTGRLANQVAAGDRQPAFAAGAALRDLAERTGQRPAALAIAFTLANPDVCSALLGASTPEQVSDNVRARDALASLDAQALAELRAIGGTGVPR